MGDRVEDGEFPEGLEVLKTERIGEQILIEFADWQYEQYYQYETVGAVFLKGMNTLGDTNESRWAMPSSVIG